MIKVVRTTQFKRDIKHYMHNREAIEGLTAVVSLLENGLPIPAVMRPHKLTGNYKGCMECHIENDTLLIWIDMVANEIKLLRFGSHSELF